MPIERAIFAMVAQRAIAPSSKLCLCQDWIKNAVYFPETDELEVQHFYRGMDSLFEHLEGLEINLYNQLVDLLRLDVSVIFYDTTSIYFEIEQEDENKEEREGLRKRGYCKDHRSDLPQVIVGMAINRDGYPIRHWVFPGNTTDVTTVARVVKDLGALRPRQFVFVGDRGMVSERSIDFLESGRLKYILRIQGRSDPLASEAVSKKGRFIKVKESLWVKEKILQHEARKMRYILCYNPKEAKGTKKDEKEHSPSLRRNSLTLRD